MLEKRNSFFQILSRSEHFPDRKPVKLRKLGMIFRFEDLLFTTEELNQLFSFHILKTGSAGIRYNQVFGVVETHLKMGNGMPVPLCVCILQYFHPNINYLLPQTTCEIILTHNQSQVDLIGTGTWTFLAHFGRISKETLAEFKKKVIEKYFG